ncbi:MAG: glycosyltransferase family 39 protein [Planctomycetota bacterium]|jgi:hypothetical protein
MAVSQNVNRPVGKGDLLHLGILLLLALGIGVYMIANTVLISRDGVFYIEQAQNFVSNPCEVIQAHPFGYPFLILAAHRVAELFFDGTSVQSWIYAAQSVTLFCRVLALAALYILGRLFVGPRESFLAILILVFLPFPAEFGSDVMRDWPHLLFLVTGFLLLVLGSGKGKWWLFGFGGLVAGLGYMIRPECAQLVVYGVLWLLIGLLRPKPKMPRAASVGALVVLLAGFAIPMIPYMLTGGRVPPAKLKDILSSCTQLSSGTSRESDTDMPDRAGAVVGAGLTGDVALAVRTLIGRVSGNLIHFFMPALLVGIYFRSRKKSELSAEEKFFVPLFTTFNIFLMVLLYCNYGYVTVRHCLPLAVFTIFYVPDGLRTIGDWLGNLLGRRWLKLSVAGGRRVDWFHILLVSGLTVCVAKLGPPIRIEKQGYIEAAYWLKHNTGESDIIAVPDRRISFYAGRTGSLYVDSIPKQATYALKIIGDENQEPGLGRPAQKQYTVPVDRRKKQGKKIVVYRLL